jgi:hypothetical protein
LKKLLAKAPQHRYQRPDDLVTDLLAFAARYGLEVPSSSVTQRRSAVPAETPRWVRHLPWLLPLGMLGVAVLGLALFGPAGDDATGPRPIHHAAGSEGSGVPTRHSQDAPGTALPGTGRATETQARGTTATNDDSSTKAVEGVAAASRSTVAGAHSTEKIAIDVSKLADKSTRATNSSAQDSVEQPAASDVSSTPDSGSPAAPKIRSREKPSATDWLGSLRDQFESLLSSQSPSASRIARLGQPGARLPTDAVPSDAHASPSDANASSLSANDDATGTKASAASPAASTSRGSSDERSAAAGRQGPLIVDPASEAPRSAGEFATLADACRAARNGDVIELHVNGPIGERPIDLVGVRLTIRAGEGYSPVVRFQPQKVDPLRESRAMLTLTGSQLTLVDLQLEFDVPRQAVAENWTMAEIRPGESLRLVGCTLTVRNASDSAKTLEPEVSMFDVRAVPGPGMMSDDPPVMRPPASVQLKNCVLRGEALVVRSNELQPVQIDWENGLLATTERFLSADGGPSDPKPQGETQLKLRHVTALMRDGLCRLTNSQDAPQQLPLEITASDCIFLCDAPAALVEQSGIDATDEYRKRIVWNGERNFYEGFTTFWRIRVAGSDIASQSTLHDWQAYWGSRESQPSPGKVAWQQLPPATRPVNRYTTSDFALQTGDNPARRSAADGTDAGLQAGLLPPSP